MKMQQNCEAGIAPGNRFFAPFTVAEPVFPPLEVNAADYETLQRAVDACAAQGGGTVQISGVWQTGPLHLHSDIRLLFAKGCEVHFSTKPSDYLPVVFTRWEGTECYNYSPLIYAKDCSNLALCGEGKLFGHGEAWWDWKNLQQAAADALYQQAAAGVPVKKRVYGTVQAALRPSFVQFIDCKNILLEGFEIIDGPQWTLHPVYCENVVIRRVAVHTTGPNTDGLNPDSCCNVLIENSEFSTGDDCVAVNSGLNEDGWRVGRPCRNIEIRNCTMNGGHGGVVIGSAISGGAENIYAHDCQISGTMQGIRLKSMRGRGGYIRNVCIENIALRDISNEGIQINMFYGYSTVQPKTQTPTQVKNVRVHAVHGKNIATCVELKGLPEQKLENIVLSDIALAGENAFVCAETESIHMENVQL